MNFAMRNGFTSELARFGPAADYPPFDLTQAQSYCARLARTYYENFTVASWLLPRPIRSHFHAVYAFCRWADDLADESGGSDQALDLLRWWREELKTCYEGKPRHPITIALRETIRRFEIPPTPFTNLIVAFEQDQSVKHYETAEQLLAYCRCSANPVGHIVLYLLRSFDCERAELADQVCTGLQLANFWQDVCRDWAMGRVYVPAEDRKRFGYAESELEGRRCTREFRELMRYEVDWSRGFFMRGSALPPLLPWAVRSDVELFIAGGLAILGKIEQLDYNVWAARPTLSRWEKARLISGAIWRRARSTSLGVEL